MPGREFLFASVTSAAILLMPAHALTQQNDNTTYIFGELKSYYQNIERVRISVDVDIGSTIAPQHEQLNSTITSALHNEMLGEPYSVEIQYHPRRGSSHILEPIDILMSIQVVADLGTSRSFGSVSCDTFRTNASMLPSPYFYNTHRIFSEPFLVDSDSNANHFADTLDRILLLAERCAIRLRSSISINSPHSD